MNRPKFDMDSHESKTDSTAITIPDLAWKRGTCCVCGKSFDHLNQRQPATCKDGDCRYKYRYKIDHSSWADYQPTLFDSIAIKSGDATEFHYANEDSPENREKFGVREAKKVTG